LATISNKFTYLLTNLFISGLSHPGLLSEAGLRSAAEKDTERFVRGIAYNTLRQS